MVQKQKWQSFIKSLFINFQELCGVKTKTRLSRDVTRMSDKNEAAPEKPQEEQAPTPEASVDTPETSEKPRSRQKRSIINVPERNNIGPDGEAADEF